MTKQDKLKRLDELLLDNYIEAMSNGDVKPMELGPIVTYLKMNQIVSDKEAEEGTAAKIKRLVRK